MIRVMKALMKSYTELCTLPTYEERMTSMTLIELAFAIFWLVIIIFGSVFFAEWAEKHTQSYALEIFAHFGMPALLWCVMLVLYELLRKNGVVG